MSQNLRIKELQLLPRPLPSCSCAVFACFRNLPVISPPLTITSSLHCAESAETQTFIMFLWGFVFINNQRKKPICSNQKTLQSFDESKENIFWQLLQFFLSLFLANMNSSTLTAKSSYLFSQSLVLISRLFTNYLLRQKQTRQLRMNEGSTKGKNDIIIGMKLTLAFIADSSVSYISF